MQDTQPDHKECRHVGIGEQIINFRPSPNTSVIKKFRKVNLDGSDQAGPGDIDMKHSISPEYEVTVKEEKPSFHPPLPPDSPPRSRSASPSMNLGMEMTELDDTQRLVEHARLMIREEANVVETAEKKKGCRDFIRGTCNRVGCKFVHDLTQREGVYTFCRNFQNSNSKCTYPHCKFVHATVFEEQAFYRTGVLPPHTTAHQKKPEATNSADMKNAIKLLLTPPPPPPPPGKATTNITNAYTKTSDSTSVPHSSQNTQSKSSTSMPLVKVIPEASAAASIGNSLAKPWTAPEINGESATPDQKAEKNDPSKCEGCVVNENRLQHFMTIAKSMTESLQDVTQKMEALDLQEKRFNAVVVYLSKTMGENPSNGFVNCQIASLLTSLGPEAYLLGRQ